jgi:hypothetical protein
MLLLVRASEPLGAQRRVEVLGVSTPVPIVRFSVEARVLESLPRERGVATVAVAAWVLLVCIGLRS